MKKIKYLVLTLLMYSFSQSVQAIEMTPPEETASQTTQEPTKQVIETTDSTTTQLDESAPVELNKEGNASQTQTLQTQASTTTINTEPVITNILVTGDYDDKATGVDYYKNITISLIGDNLTNHHFLTKEGLRWSDKTTVEVINSAIVGQANGHKAFGRQNAPNTPITLYRNHIGDSGRITFVGQTKSGIDLDLIWTVTDSNQEDWQNNSKYRHSTLPKGIGFYGEQSIPGSTGNSIVVVYNNTSHIGIKYQIVKHGTFDEQPVVLSFISTDI